MLEDIFRVVDRNVSRETFFILQKFVKILIRWNEKINLISKKSSEVDIWRSHILDSILISQHIDSKEKIVMDIGSGAGFPGIILAIIGHKNCILVEKNSKKTAFLNTVASELQLEVIIENKDVRNIIGYVPDYITSRAMTSISEIIEMTIELQGPETEFLFHVGKNDYKKEIRLLEKKRSFELQERQNPYKSECIIVSIKKIKEYDR